MLNMTMTKVVCVTVVVAVLAAIFDSEAASPRRDAGQTKPMTLENPGSPQSDLAEATVILSPQPRVDAPPSADTVPPLALPESEVDPAATLSPDPASFYRKPSDFDTPPPLN